MQSPRQVTVAPDAKTFAEEVALTQKRLRFAFKLQSQFLDPSKVPRDGKTYTASAIRTIFSDIVKSMDVCVHTHTWKNSLCHSIYLSI